MSKLKFGEKTIKLPANRLARTVIALLLIIGGILGFLPILGFWMIPLGLMILSIDIPSVRRWRRKTTVKLGTYLKRKSPKLAKMLGFNTENGN